MKYIPRIKIRKADRLSKKLDWKIEVEKDNENQTLIKETIRVVEEIKKVGVKVL